MNTITLILCVALALAGVIVVWRTPSDEIYSKLNYLKESVVRHFYSTKSWILGALGLAIYEVMTENVSSHFYSLKTETQLGIIVFFGGIIGLWWVGGKVIHLMYTADLRTMVVLDPQWGGEFDVLRGGREKFRRMGITGADALREKPTPHGGRVLLAEKYDHAKHEAVATWKQLADPVEQEKSYKNIKANTYILEEKLDEARDIISSLVPMRLKFRDEADKGAMRKVDEMHFEDDEDTEKLVSEVVDEYDYEEDETVVEEGDIEQEDEIDSTPEDTSETANSGGEGDE